MLCVNHGQGANATDGPCDTGVVLHVGLPKTATTLLQTRFFPHHPQVAYLGKVAGNTFASPQIEWLVSQTLRQGAFHCPRDACRAVYQRDVEPLLGQGQAVVLSLEDGTHGSPRRRQAKLENLRAVFGTCRLLIALRRPVQFLESLYLQRLKHLNFRANAFGRPLWYVSIDQWLTACDERGEKAELSHLDYANYIADWEAAFGRENVGVLLYEQFREDPQVYLDQLCSYLGIRRVSADEVVGGGIVNPRIKASAAERLAEISRSRWRSLTFRFTPAKRRKRWVGEKTGQDAKASLGDAWQRRVEDAVRPGNRVLAERRNLPLAAYGYPL